MLKILLSLIIAIAFPLGIFAQQDTTLNEVTGDNTEVKAAEIDELNQKEEERTQQIANLLGFVLPPYTDNPSYVITFKDPSPEKKGVEISLDGKGFTVIKSPYTFPALSIGNHNVKFRFYDATNTIKILEYELIVTPRAPIVNTPKLSETSISITGTALSNSEVIYTLSANAYNSNGYVKTDSNGDWSITLTPEEGLSNGIYTFTAFVRKYGYASDFSSPLTFSVGENGQAFVGNNTKDIYFSFASINKDNVLDILKSNRDLIFLVVANFLLGVILASIIKSIIDNSKSEKKIKEVETIMNKPTEENGRELKTLREIFGGESKENEEIEKEADKKEVKKDTEEKKQETIINKDIFLKRYKGLDPDNDSGKEKEKKIKISLTTKEE